MLKGRTLQPLNRWWSVKVPGWETMLDSPAADQVDFLLGELNPILVEQVERLETARRYTLQFEDLRSDIDNVVADLTIWLQGSEIRKKEAATSLAAFVR